jgi:hypothetical protein
MENDGSRSFGRIRVAESQVKEAPLNVAKMFSKITFLPLRAEHIYISGYFEYQGWSPVFRRLSAGEGIPEYVIHAKELPNGGMDDVTVEELAKLSTDESVRNQKVPIDYKHSYANRNGPRPASCADCDKSNSSDPCCGRKAGYCTTSVRSESPRGCRSCDYNQCLPPSSEEVPK